ncbi:hypothetical protein GCM10010267_55940 [Streptomyces griseorubens]|nr:hypothetical protein GCM10010267_55940 [Streptomyces griseorubens]
MRGPHLPKRARVRTPSASPAIGEKSRSARELPVRASAEDGPLTRPRCAPRGVPEIRWRAGARPFNVGRVGKAPSGAVRGEDFWEV